MHIIFDYTPYYILIMYATFVHVITYSTCTLFMLELLPLTSCFLFSPHIYICCKKQLFVLCYYPFEIQYSKIPKGRPRAKPIQRHCHSV